MPFLDGFVSDAWKTERQLLTDWACERIFAFPDVSIVTAGFNRVFCDVERLPDASEPMFKQGMGFFYTHTDDGREMRQVAAGIKERIYRDFWFPHHQTMEDLVASKLASFGTVLIVDCHSFSDIPFRRDQDQAQPRPDVCLGTDSFHTPNWLVEAVQTGFLAEGLSVKRDSPYVGCYIPTSYYGHEPAVQSIMIELNRRLYMEGETIVESGITRLNGLIHRVLVATLNHCLDV